ncbi:MAG: hypothetical protein D3924_19905, partial [Candidatus Electrothrix sp. AR4]|nr:hypothetical protein [Candidatus Electrothrix sp. AR4]
GYTKNNLRCINAVIKISKIDHAKKEIDNYNKYVKWYLPYSWRPELLGHAIGKYFGVICYSFVFNDERPFLPLTELIQREDFSSVQKVIDQVFGSGYQQWYHKSNHRKEDNLTQYYFERWFQNRKSPEDDFAKWAIKNGSITQNTVKIGNLETQLPGSYLLARIRGTYTSCLRHGDLNSNNILLSSDNYITFIDFQETGRGHLFEDFVTFELSFRQHCNLHLSAEKLLQLEYDLSDNKFVATSEKIKRWGSIIKKIRNSAFDNFEGECIYNYYYALALGAYRFFRWPISNWQKKQMGVLLVTLVNQLTTADDTANA